MEYFNGWNKSNKAPKVMFNWTRQRALAQIFVIFINDRVTILAVVAITKLSFKITYVQVDILSTLHNIIHEKLFTFYYVCPSSLKYLYGRLLFFVIVVVIVDTHHAAQTRSLSIILFLQK